MTELSDYKRMVEAPMLRQSEARIAALQSQLEDAREALRPFDRCWHDLPEGENGYHHVHMLIEPSRGFVSSAQVRDFRKAAEVFAALAPPPPSQDGGK